MNFNYQKARKLMVENQLRPNKIKDPVILNLFNRVPKELFIPEDLEHLSYLDIDISLGSNRGYLKNLHIAQLIKHAEIKSSHKILHIGALTGYVTCILSSLCFKVYAIENEEKHLKYLRENIEKNQINNVIIVKNSFKEGALSEGPFDRILIDCPIYKIEKLILSQLSNNSGQLVMIEKKHEDLSKAIRITKNNNTINKEYLFDVFSRYELYKDEERFVF